MPETPVRSRRLLWLFAATTLVPTVSLLWVGWRLVALDRLQETRRVEESRVEALDQDELFVLSLDGQQSARTLIPRTLPQRVALSPDNRQMTYTVSEAAPPAVREVSALENFLPRPGTSK